MCICSEQMYVGGFRTGFAARRGICVLALSVRHRVKLITVSQPRDIRKYDIMKTYSD